MYASLLSAAVLTGLIDAVSSAFPPSVSIKAGTLTGGNCNTTSTAAYFKSIPFALPPIKDLRFAAPQAYNKRYPGGKLDATKEPDSCIQFGAQFAETGPTSEDCLYLNIWTPANFSSTSSYPVRVWVYGGSETAGGIADPLYDGCNIAATDAIQISVNYRLGALGFLAVDSAGIPGNQAISDIVLALEWVQDNIVAFGGDPKKVVLHGQSAGAVNTFVVATLPQAPKIMSAAIPESGGGRDVSVYGQAQELGTAFTQALNCSTSDASCLQSASVSDLLSVTNTLPLLNSGFGNDGAIGLSARFGFNPYLDGKVIPNQPSTEGVQVPTVFGSTAEEGTIFVLAQSPDPSKITAKNYTDFLVDNFGSAASTIEKYYPLSAYNATPFPAFFAIENIITLDGFKCPAYRSLNRAAEKGIPAYTYLFSHQPKCSWLTTVPPEVLPLLGPTHTSEIPFVFGNTLGQPTPNGSCNFTEAEDTISANLVSAWTNMAASQNPSTGSINWPAYKPSTSLGLNIVNSSTPGYINYTQCVLWGQINQLLINETASIVGSNSTGGSNGTSTTPPTPSGSSSGSRSSSSASSTATATATGGAAGLAISWLALGGSIGLWTLL